MARLGKDVQDKVDALGAKSAEADELRKSLAAAVARVKELEGYKAKAIVAEMPKPAAPAPAAPKGFRTIAAPASARPATREKPLRPRRAGCGIKESQSA